VIGDLSARFVGIEPARFDGEIGQTLRAVVEWFDTDRASFMEFSPDLATLVNAHSWTKRSGVETSPPRMVWQSFPWYFHQLQRAATSSSATLQSNCLRRLMRSAIMRRASHAGHHDAALAIAGRVQCVISTGDFAQPREWTPIDVNRLRIIGTSWPMPSIASAVTRR